MAAISGRSRINSLLTKARYVSQQGLKSLWYGGHSAYIRRKTGGFRRPGESTFKTQAPMPKVRAIREAYMALFKADLQNIENGLYRPPAGLSPTKALRAIRVMQSTLEDSKAVNDRRLRRDGHDILMRKANQPFPEYYLQNFHYQSDGWLSDESADIYHTQVEILFAGAAAAMRRLALTELSLFFKSKDQRQMRYADLACGDGEFLREVMRNFPRLNAHGVDLSEFYLTKARHQTRKWAVTYHECAAEALPFETESMDALSAVYLFHELPADIRHKVFSEMHRVLKPGGVFVFCDSLQTGDIDEMDAMLEYFPHGFHEPYYESYIADDLANYAKVHGFIMSEPRFGFLTKAVSFVKS